MTQTESEGARGIVVNTKVASALHFSQAVLRAMMEQLGSGVVVCDGKAPGFPVLEVSDSFTGLTGFGDTEAAGEDLAAVLGLEFDGPNVEGLNSALGAGASFFGELLCQRKDGSSFWCEVLVAPFSEHCFAGECVLVLTNISDRKRSAELLADDRDKCRGMFENSVEGIYQSTVDGHYLEVNPALARMYGYDAPGELLNQVCDIQTQIYVDPSFRDRFKREIEQNGVVRGLEYQVRRRDGTIIWISETARVVRDAKGDIRYYEGFIDDITQRKETEERLKASQQQLLETSRQVGMAEVATSILHNMGNALNSINISISVASDKLKRSKVSNFSRVLDLIREHEADLGRFFTQDPKGKMVPDYMRKLAEALEQENSMLLHEVETLRTSVDHLNEIVAMQQNYARSSVIVETVRAVDLVEDALRMTGNSLARHGVEVARDFPADSPELAVPKHKVLQILLNLIRNAQKACDSSEGARKLLILRVSSTGEDQLVRFEVSDNGIGIPAENLSRIFGHGFTTRKDGHGFGLHSGALMAKEMGGSLQVQSDGPGKGATFVLTLPREFKS